MQETRISAWTYTFLTLFWPWKVIMRLESAYDATFTQQKHFSGIFPAGIYRWKCDTSRSWLPRVQCAFLDQPLYLGRHWARERVFVQAVAWGRWLSEKKWATLESKTVVQTRCSLQVPTNNPKFHTLPRVCSHFYIMYDTMWCARCVRTWHWCRSLCKNKTTSSRPQCFFLFRCVCICQTHGRLWCERFTNSEQPKALTCKS